jgi:hypothetical protein
MSVRQIVECYRCLGRDCRRCDGTGFEAVPAPPVAEWTNSPRFKTTVGLAATLAAILLAGHLMVHFGS